LQGLSSIRFLELGQNSLTGRIPSSFLVGKPLLINSYRSSEKWSAWAHHRITRTSPAAHSLSFNKLVGSIPTSLGNLHALIEIDIDNNQLEGSIAPSIFNISSLEIFNVQNNNLNGYFPPDLGSKLPNLKLFLVNGNGFHGEIPPSLCNTSDSDDSNGCKLFIRDNSQLFWNSEQFVRVYLCR